MADGTTITGLDGYYISKEEGHLTLEGGLVLLRPYGISSMSALNRAIREQGVPIRAVSPRKRYFVETEVRTWISRRTKRQGRMTAKIFMLCWLNTSKKTASIYKTIK